MKYMQNGIRFCTVVGSFTALILMAACNFGQKAEPGPNLRKGDRLTSFSQQITYPLRNLSVKAHCTFSVDVRAKNTGNQPWFGGDGRATTVDASYRWLNSNGVILAIEGKRTQLNRSVVRPGESEDLQLQVEAPANPGLYTLWISMVQEGVDWFYVQGSPPLVLHVTVT